jgi:hypothetical protein
VVTKQEFKAAVAILLYDLSGQGIPLGYCSLKKEISARV